MFEPCSACGKTPSFYREKWRKGMTERRRQATTTAVMITGTTVVTVWSQSNAAITGTVHETAVSPERSEKVVTTTTIR